MPHARPLEPRSRGLPGSPSCGGSASLWWVSSLEPHREANERPVCPYRVSGWEWGLQPAPEQSPWRSFPFPA